VPDALAQYRALQDQYDALIWGEPNGVGREEKRASLVRQADALWPRLTRPQQSEAVQHATNLYHARIGAP
jgi:hypothetical protein